MSPRLQNFLLEKRILLDTDWAALFNWNKETTKAKFARREVPKFIKVKSLKIIKYDDAEEFLLKQDTAQEKLGAKAAAADLLKNSK